MDAQENEIIRKEPLKGRDDAEQWMERDDKLVHTCSSAGRNRMWNMCVTQVLRLMILFLMLDKAAPLRRVDYFRNKYVKPNPYR